MNKNTEKKVYVAPQMTVLQMKTTCQLLQNSTPKKASYQNAIINTQGEITGYDGTTDFN